MYHANEALFRIIGFVFRPSVFYFPAGTAGGAGATAGAVDGAASF